MNMVVILSFTLLGARFSVRVLALVQFEVRRTPNPEPNPETEREPSTENPEV
jgi:hypothetical protein